MFAEVRVAAQAVGQKAIHDPPASLRNLLDHSALHALMIAVAFVGRGVGDELEIGPVEPQRRSHPLPGFSRSFIRAGEHDADRLDRARIVDRGEVVMGESDVQIVKRYGKGRLGDDKLQDGIKVVIELERRAKRLNVWGTDSHRRLVSVVKNAFEHHREAKAFGKADKIGDGLGEVECAPIDITKLERTGDCAVHAHGRVFYLQVEAR